jgi:serine/threonine-protein kinase PknK
MTSTQPAGGVPAHRLDADTPVTRIGYGAMQLAGPGVWGRPDDPGNAVAVLREAVALGVNFLDTANAYGPRTVNQLIAAALHPYPDGLIVGNKVGADRGPDRSWLTDNRPETLRRQVHDALTDLRVEASELTYLRLGGDGQAAPSDVPLEDSLGALVELSDQGLIRRIGLSGANPGQLRRARGVPTLWGTAERAAGSPRAPRVVLADDDVLLREGLASLLERSGFEVAGQAGNSTELLALARSARPELAIIDIRMPPGHATEGLEAARVIREELPAVAIVVLSAHVEVDEAMDLLAGGERTGYLLKSRITDVAEFIATVGRITAGASVVDPSLVQELVKARRRHDPLDVLSPREREVLALMAEGASNAGIAQAIFVTEGTVEKHVRSILTKLNLPESTTEHRRVLAVLRFLEAR